MYVLYVSDSFMNKQQIEDVCVVCVIIGHHMIFQIVVIKINELIIHDNI